MKAEIWENGGISMDDIKRNRELSNLEPLTTWGLTEDDIKGQKVPQPPAPTEKGDEALINDIPKDNKMCREFLFKPMQFVKINVFGLDYHGRIVRCIKENDTNLYDVQYVFEGQLKRAEFYEDEII